VSPAYIRQACEASLRRLGTEYIDLYQLHAGVEDAAGALRVIEVLEGLVAEGKILAYGASVDDPALARAFAKGPRCIAVQHQLNVFGTNEETLRICEERGLASINRSPLAMGLLTGKYAPGKNVPPPDDVRRDTPHWDYFDDEAMEIWTQKLEKIRQALTEDGRTLAQGALSWIWAKSAATIPIPGFRTEAQVEENAGAMRFGPLSAEAMSAIDDALGRRTETVS
jgi:aryl-alcohol dehydrogenase-like predicted oxidoreductase